MFYIQTPMNFNSNIITIFHIHHAVHKQEYPVLIRSLLIIVHTCMHAGSSLCKYTLCFGTILEQKARQIEPESLHGIYKPVTYT